MSARTVLVLTVVLKTADEDNLETAMWKFDFTDDMWILSPGKAFDATLVYDRELCQADLRQVQTTMISIKDDLPFKADLCVQARDSRKKSVLLCDMDSTLIGQECIDELADFVGVKDRVSEITERAMRGEIDFESALTERVKLLKKLPLSKLQTCFDERILLNPGARTLCQTMRKNGAHTVIVSGGFTFFTQRVAEACGFHEHFANTLIEDGNALTGEVGMPILGREAKLSTLMRVSENRGGASSVICLGDGANDLAMIHAAGLGVAYYAKPAVAEAADCAINHTDLTTALYFQGYREEEFLSS